MSAKAFGIKVNEFSIGMGPKLFSKQFKGTYYSLRALPIGGFCAMEGEDGENISMGSFGAKPIYQRSIVLIAGAFMNLLLGLVISTVLFASGGPIASTTVADFAQGATSKDHGMQAGDRIVSLGGARVFTASDIAFNLVSAGEKPVAVSVVRNGQRVELKDVRFPVLKDGENTSQYADFIFAAASKTPVEVIKQGTLRAYSFTKFIWRSMVMVITGQVSVKQLSGPVGTTAVIGSAAAQGFPVLMFFIMFITINLGIVNLLPLPALDGGRLVFLAVEKIIGRPVSKELEGAVNFAGLALLMLLMVVVTFNDIVKLLGF